jgi:hypothetical protein
LLFAILLGTHITFSTLNRFSFSSIQLECNETCGNLFLKTAWQPERMLICLPDGQTKYSFVFGPISLECSHDFQKLLQN